MGRKLMVEDLLSFRLPGSVAMAPGGDRAAYVVSRIDKEKNETHTSIYIAVPGRAAMRFTGGENDSVPKFSPDGCHLAFVSRRSGQAQVWVMPADGGEARQLTRIQGGVVEFEWAPDSARIAFTALLRDDGIQPEVKEEKDPDLFKQHTKSVKAITENAHKLDGVGWFGERRASVCIIGLEEAAEPLQLTQPPYSLSELAFTPDGTQVLFAGRMGADYDKEAFEQQIYAISVDGGEARQITPSGLSAAAPAVSPDGAFVAFLASDPAELGYDNDRLYTVPLAGGEPVLLAAGWDRPFGNTGLTDMPAPAGGRPVWSPDGAALFALSSVDGTTQFVQVDVATGEVRPLTTGDHLIYSFSLDARRRKAVLGKAEPLNPGDVFWLDLREGALERLTALNQELLAELDLAQPRRFSAQAAGGPALDAWLMQPRGFQEGQQYPAVLAIHGGPMAMYAAAFFFEFQLLAAEGFGVIYANPRGSQGYGEAFCKAIQTEWGNKDYADIMAVLETSLAESPWIDHGRLGVTGGSYGGFMTNWIVGHTDRFKAAVTGRSICDWRTMIGTGDGGPYWIRRFGGVAPWVDDSVYKQQSPITYVENVRTPILIEHQEGDLRCPIDQGMAWYSAIKFLGKAPVRFVTYPGEFHGMSRNGKPWNRIHRLREITGWFARYLTPEA